MSAFLSQSASGKTEVAQVDYADLVNVPPAFPASPHTHDWTTDITGKPSTFPPDAHVHAHATLTGLGVDDHTQYFNTARGDARYSLLGHDHDADYAPLVHVHDHSTLTGLGADGHTQYFNTTRGDARYALLAHAHALDDLTDVVAPAPVDGYRLAWDELQSQWEPRQSTSALNIVTFAYRWNSPVDTTPASGRVSSNNSDPSLVTEIYVHEEAEANHDKGLFYESLIVGDEFRVFEKADDANFAAYLVAGAATQAGEVFTIPVTFDTTQGPPHAGNERVDILLRFKSGVTALRVLVNDVATVPPDPTGLDIELLSNKIWVARWDEEGAGIYFEVEIDVGGGGFVPNTTTRGGSEVYSKNTPQSAQFRVRAINLQGMVSGWSNSAVV